MDKLMVIHNCYECRHTSTVDCREHGCFLMGKRKIKTNIFIEIPDWCPLPDAPIGKKNQIGDKDGGQ